MKKISKAAAAMAVGIACAMPAMAQEDAGQTTSATANIENPATDDDDRSMGWIGLLGLVGLLGLKRKRHEHHVEHRAEYRPDVRNPHHHPSR